ncbi:hypothetical protein J6590_042808 [Homalodisca vitripennis]|nr:hypothetical protein J6590_042808 [Homalodisca vitripennis]
MGIRGTKIVLLVQQPLLVPLQITENVHTCVHCLARMRFRSNVIRYTPSNTDCEVKYLAASSGSSNESIDRYSPVRVCCRLAFRSYHIDRSLVTRQWSFRPECLRALFTDDEVGEQSRTPDQGRSSTPEIPPSRLRRQSAGDILEAELRGEYEPEVLASQRRRAARSSIAGLPHHHHFGKPPDDGHGAQYTRIPMPSYKTRSVRQPAGINSVSIVKTRGATVEEDLPGTPLPEDTHPSCKDEVKVPLREEVQEEDNAPVEFSTGGIPSFKNQVYKIQIYLPWQFRLLNSSCAQLLIKWD